MNYLKPFLLGFLLGTVLFYSSSCGPVGPQGPTGPEGPQGPTGVPGADAFVAMINPCDDAPGILDEILLVMSDGTVIASVSANANGDNTRFSVLPPGTYVTTDGDHCTFTLEASGTLSYESH